jgi:hypothetical protein
MKISIDPSEVTAAVQAWLVSQPHYQRLAVELWLASQGHPVADSDAFTLEADGSVTVEIGAALAPAAPLTAPPPQAPAPAVSGLIGQTIDGYKVTHYGYPGDSSPDSESMKGIGDRGNKLTALLSVAMTRSARQKQFGQLSGSTGKEFSLGGNTLRDDDSAPEEDLRVDVYDPFYAGVDTGCTAAMYAKSKSEMVAAGILTA